MVEVTPFLPGLSPVSGKTLQVRFDGGAVSSDGGLLLFGEIERRLGLAPRLAACLNDGRDPERVTHTTAEILRFRMLGIVAGWLAGEITKGRGFGLVGDLVVGILGSLLGSFIFGLAGLGAYSLLGRLVVSVVDRTVILACSIGVGMLGLLFRAQLSRTALDRVASNVAAERSAK